MFIEIGEVEPISANFQNARNIAKVTITSAHAMPIELLQNNVFWRSSRERQRLPSLELTAARLKDE